MLLETASDAVALMLLPLRRAAGMPEVLPPHFSERLVAVTKAIAQRFGVPVPPDP